MRAAFFSAVLAIAVDESMARDQNWLSGAALAQKLAEPATLSWTNTPAQRIVENLSDSQRVAILLDRRIDPQQEVTLATSDVPLGEALAQLADRLQAGYCQFGPVAYFGPRETANKMRTIGALRLADVKSSDKERAAELLRLRAWQWDDLAEPRQLLADLAQQAGAELADEGRIPHDLWRGADLPPLSWIDRLTLLAAQFDLTFRLEDGGRRVRLVPLPARAQIVRQYNAPRNARELAAQWAQAVPQAQIRAEGNKIVLAGRLEDHELIEQRFQPAPRRRTTVTPGEQRFQLAVENAALDAVMAQLAERLQLDVKWDAAGIEAAGVSKDQLISVRVKDATLDELLAAVLANTALAFERNDKTVTIVPAK